LLRRDWPSGDSQPHIKATQKLQSLARLLTAAGRPTEAARLHKAADAARRRDLVIKLAWQGEASLDLRVLEPTGSTCSVLQKQTIGGGTLIGGSVGSGPHEAYVCAEGFSGDYTVTVERVWGQPLGNKAQLRIIRHQGTPDETEELVTVALATELSRPLTV